jgi:DNA-binding response OmpR family regulator
MKAHVILLVSKDSEVINAIEEAVFGERHGLRVVADRAAAVSALAADDIDLIILDHNPDLHDLDLFHTARGRVPVLVLTSREPKAMNAILRRHGAGSCITKPFTEAGLNAAVHELLAPKAVGAA